MHVPLPFPSGDDVMAENGEVPEDLSPVERIPPKEPLPVAKKPSPNESDRLGGGTREGREVGGGRAHSRTARRLPPTTSSIGAISLSPGGVVSMANVTTPTSSPRKGKKEEGWKEVGKRYAVHVHVCLPRFSLVFVYIVHE